MIALLLLSLMSYAAPGFERDGKSGQTEVWRDSASGHYWSDKLQTQYGRDEAESACKKLEYKDVHFRLPSDKDFALMEKHGGREKLPSFADEFYWTSTVHPKSGNVRMVYNGNFGGSAWIIYNMPFESVRCVGERKSK